MLLCTCTDCDEYDSHCLLPILNHRIHTWIASPDYVLARAMDSIRKMWARVTRRAISIVNGGCHAGTDIAVAGTAHYTTCP
ncbi:uncharacterized protein LAESUDRAFT_726256 [Laetiporus sulphureus 93-53]|uniref:Uncharacterized protein n=1 Tax=Laetiporus sulphureus 93-53 TaxID=1314785 RepID=A0A165E182_9APHY|nr:uncharacterized protein LAESUDRAFT_726256 [Laetiporus sulphureus 93-53]KZT06053.1 hypothetical protein LAESUDRAFT_726256 [Laetiporus sulphureus 93-53]